MDGVGMAVDCVLLEVCFAQCPVLPLVCFAAFSVEPSHTHCEVTPDNCVTDGEGEPGLSGTCTITMLARGSLVGTEWQVGLHGTMTLNGERMRHEPRGLLVEADDEFVWTGGGQGFTMCWSPGLTISSPSVVDRTQHRCWLA